MTTINNAQKLCDEISDAYNEEFSNAVFKLRSYVQILVGQLSEDKYTTLNERLKILNFIENKFNTDINGFFSFIKRLNNGSNIANSQSKIEEYLREELGYKGDGIIK